MILFTKRVRFTRHKDKAWTKLVQEIVHQLVKAVYPRRDILTVVMIIKTFNHLPHIVELIKEG